MALLKSKTLKDGTTGEYWKIIGILVDRFAKAAKFEIALFQSQAAAQAGATPMQMRKTKAFMMTSEELAGDITAVGYEKIKSQAAVMLDKDLAGKPCEPYPADADLVGATDI